MPILDDIRVVSETGLLLSTGTTEELLLAPVSDTASITINGDDLGDKLRSVIGLSLGNGIDLYTNTTGKNDLTLNFRSIVEGPGIVLSLTENNEIQIASTVAVTYDLGNAQGILPVSKGGTGRTDNITNGIMLGAGNTYSFLTPPDSTRMLTWNATSNAYIWENIPTGSGSTAIQKPPTPADNSISVSENTSNYLIKVNQNNLLLNNMSGVLPISKGGTGRSMFTSNNILLGGGSGDLSELQPNTGFLKYDATSKTYSWVSINGGVQSITLTSNNNDLFITNPTITTSGTINLVLSDTGVAAGTYTNPTITVDYKGRVTNISSNPNSGLSSVGVNIGSGEGIYSSNLGSVLQFKKITGSNGVTVTSTADTVNISIPTPQVIPTSLGGTGLSTLGDIGQSLRVNSTKTGLEYYTPSTGGNSTSISSITLQTSNNLLSITNPTLTTSGIITLAVSESNININNISGVLSPQKGGLGNVQPVDNSIVVSTATGYKLLPPPAKPSTLNYTVAGVEWGNANTSVTVPPNICLSYTFTLNYTQGSLTPNSVSDLPQGWTYTIAGQDIIITHTVGQSPIFLTMMGLDTAAIPNVFKLMYPTSTNPMTIPSELINGIPNVSTTQFKFRGTTSATGATTGSGASIAKIKVTF